MFQLSWAGESKEGRAFDVLTSNGAFAGIIVENYGRHTEVYFNTSATKGSKRKFQNVTEALEFIYQRRLSKGFKV